MPSCQRELWIEIHDGNRRVSRRLNGKCSDKRRLPYPAFACSDDDGFHLIDLVC